MGWFGDLLEETGLSGLLSDGRWVTLKNARRVKLDAAGRIVAGLPAKYHGIHVGDFGRVSKEERELLGVDCDELASCHKCEKTFKSKDHAFRALLAANPDLDELRTSEFGAYDVEWLRWRRGGRVGKKPRTKITDGRLDAINEYYDLKGANRVASFTEAIYYTIPTSRRWRDLGPRLEQLEEASGMKLNPPEEALRLEAAGLDYEQCRDDVERQIGELYKNARAGRLEAKPDPDRVPF